ncbi:WGR domain-containing protein [Candidatus Cyrtobacter comes]|uniref:WGR domain-containing protein n=1 Tax=Candidatus Cyrtobacter comes TaxID=675776 RepID=A0ABU5L9P6_9RICK|nr:WGR domain-containing protein [Candidatus Cyrtobacter comes]MDZ5762842.1 WGR domain-containing protein [Candidatus Cyrtobacter comes]
MNLYWIAKTKFYQISLEKTLFDETILRRTWGSIQNKSARSKTHFVTSDNEIKKLIAQVHKKRIARGYRLLNDLQYNDLHRHC